MRSSLIRLLICSAVVLSAGAVSTAEAFSRTSLIDTDQNQALVQSLQANLSLERPASSSFKTAAVHFIVGKSGQSFDTQENDFTDPTVEDCKRFGYAVTSCASGLFNQVCPYNDKVYDKCCDAAYTYTASTCPAPKQLSSDSCGGKYKCSCDRSAYPYDACDSPQIRGEACVDEAGTHYKTCSCPTSASAPYGCQEYYAAPCGSVCKTAYSDNCRNRTSVQTPYGCESYFSDCSSKCQTAYTDNCRNRNNNDYGHGCQKWWSDCQSKCEVPYTDGCHNRTAVATPYGCESYFSDCGSKCQTAYTDNCRNRTAVATPYGCKQAFEDCASKCQTAYSDNCHNRTAVETPYGCKSYFSDCALKCQTAYSDNCHNRTAVISSCPTNATCSYFSDCSSKIQSWSCKAGYGKSGNSCIVSCQKYEYCYAAASCVGAPVIREVSDGCGGKCTICPDIYCPDYGYSKIGSPWEPSSCSNWVYCPIDSSYRRCY